MIVLLMYDYRSHSNWPCTFFFSLNAPGCLHCELAVRKPLIPKWCQLFWFLHWIEIQLFVIANIFFLLEYPEHPRYCSLHLSIHPAHLFQVQSGREHRRGVYVFRPAVAGDIVLLLRVPGHSGAQSLRGLHVQGPAVQGRRGAVHGVHDLWR